MGLSYIKLYHDFMEETQPLTDAEVGRLVRAMLCHARGDAPPEALLTGNERFLYPRWRLQIDRDVDVYDQRCETSRRNGTLGAAPASARRPRSPPRRSRSPRRRHSRPR